MSNDRENKPVQAVQLTIPIPAPSGRGAVLMVQAELNEAVVKLFKSECRRQKVTQKQVVEYLVAGWIAQHNPVEAKRLKLVR